MLLTTLGAIKLFVNDEELGFTAKKLDVGMHCQDVNGRYLIQYDYTSEIKKNQVIKCCIPSIDVKGDSESGERLEAISFYQNDIKLTIGVDGEFSDFPKDIDYSGDYLNNGIQYETYNTTANRKFYFGVFWIQPLTEENDVQTWFGADPTLMQNYSL